MFKNKFALFALTFIALSVLVGCGDDSSTNPGVGQSGYTKEAFRVARPANYVTQNGLNYYIYYWGSCTIDNGVYQWDPQGSMDIYAYILSNDTLKADFRSNAEYNNDTSFGDDFDYFLYGKNSSIFGTWDVHYCYPNKGEYKCSTQLFNSTIEFKQDSMITYMTLNPDYNMVNDIIHDIFHDYFSFCIYDKQEDEDAYFVDMPERGITFSYQDNRNATITIQGQVVNISTGGFTEAKAIHYNFSISSNGITCSSETRFGYVNKAEYCSEAYKSYLTDDGENEEKGNNIISTHYLRDKGNAEEYTSCLTSLFKNNPAYKPEKE
ncbi:MAG: hypothetical protein IKS97_05355 [Fibrobacter sp.]|nr:hypothetical protein [Fibrobacter sp.]